MLFIHLRDPQLLQVLLLLIGYHQFCSFHLPAVCATPAAKKCTLVFNVTEERSDREPIGELFKSLRDCPQFSGRVLPIRNQIGTFRALSSNTHLELTHNGSLVALRGFDRESICPWATSSRHCVLTLEALLMGAGPGVEDIPLEIAVRVVDLDDCWPAWDESLKTVFTMPENTLNGSKELIARVVDPDVRQPHQVAHHFAPHFRSRPASGAQPSPWNPTFELFDTHGAFALVEQHEHNSSSGGSDVQTHVELYLQLVRPLDRETRDTYAPRLCMRAFQPAHRDPRRDPRDERWEPERNATNTVYRNCRQFTVSVSDVNDEAPAFVPQTPRRLPVSENTQTGRVIANVTAVDRDLGAP